jgi:hypothetical protein
VQLEIFVMVTPSHHILQVAIFLSRSMQWLEAKRPLQTMPLVDGKEVNWDCDGEDIKVDRGWEFVDEGYMKKIFATVSPRVIIRLNDGIFGL